MRKGRLHFCTLASNELSENERIALKMGKMVKIPANLKKNLKFKKIVERKKKSRAKHLKRNPMCTDQNIVASNEQQTKCHKSSLPSTLLFKISQQIQLIWKFQRPRIAPKTQEKSHPQL